MRRGPPRGCWTWASSPTCSRVRSTAPWRSVSCAPCAAAGATKYYPAEQVLKDAGLADKGGMAFTKGAGCERCHNSGYRGRAGIYEIMEVTDDIRRLIHRASPTHELRATLREQRVLTLREEGVRLAMRGRSSLEEVLRATHVDDESEPVGTERQTGTPAAEDGRRRDVA
ncbi:MAG: ATPase, T2SS/T4P/T4SS family [Planctomycetota bacterium]